MEDEDEGDEGSGSRRTETVDKGKVDRRARCALAAVVEPGLRVKGQGPADEVDPAEQGGNEGEEATRRRCRRRRIRCSRRGRHCCLCYSQTLSFSLSSYQAVGYGEGRGDAEPAWLVGWLVIFLWSGGNSEGRQGDERVVVVVVMRSVPTTTRDAFVCDGASARACVARGRTQREFFGGGRWREGAPGTRIGERKSDPPLLFLTPPSSTGI